jgi:hypothetical protein
MKMISLDSAIITVAAIGFMLMGLIAIAAPTRVTKQFDITVLSVNGCNEVRAVYGGFGLAIACMLWISLHIFALRAGICLTVGAALAGMMAGRIVSLVLDHSIGRFPLIYGCIEFVGAGLLFYVALGFSTS